MEKIHKRKNTVIYLAEVSIDYLYAKTMFEEIASQLITDDTSVILCLETSPEILQRLKLPVGPLPTGKPANRITTLYQLIPDGKQSKWEQIPFDSPGFNMRFHWHLTVFFRKYIIEERPAERYFLFLWGHGTSYSLFPRKVVEGSEAGESIGHLSADHLSRAIIDASIFKSPFRISVILMINCYMQTIETGYELSIAQTDYLVAPENIGSWEGYDYVQLFRILFTNPAVTSDDFARKAITTLNSRVPPIKDTDNSLSKSVFSAIHLQNYGVLFRLIDELSIKLLQIPETDISRFLATGPPTTSKNGTVDLGDFLYTLQVVFKDSYGEMHAIISRIIMVLIGKELIVERFIGKDVMLATPPSYHGIAIGFMGLATRGISLVYVRYMHRPSPFSSTFTRTSTWGQFTEKYYPG